MYMLLAKCLRIIENKIKKIIIEQPIGTIKKFKITIHMLDTHRKRSLFIFS